MRYAYAFRRIHKPEAEQAALSSCRYPDVAVSSAYDTYMVLALMNGEYFPASGGKTLNDLRNYVRTNIGSTAQIVLELDTYEGVIGQYTPAPIDHHRWGAVATTKRAIVSHIAITTQTNKRRSVGRLVP
jgi:hypothetical protein